MKKLYTFIFSLFLYIHSSSAVDLYWKGGNGDFNDPNMWWVGSFNSGTTHFQSPISTDNVFFEQAAFAGIGPSNITINTNANCANMYWDNTIALADLPTVTSPENVRLDIYGYLHLARNIDFNFNGQIRLRTNTAGIIPITTNGQHLRVTFLIFDGGNNTIFELQDSLYVDDPNEGTTVSGKGVIELHNGILDANEQNIRCDYFQTVGTLATRGLDISNTTIDIHGHNASATLRHWKVTFDPAAMPATHQLFDATGSKIHFHTYSGDNQWKHFWGGRGIAYDSIVADKLIDFYYCHSSFNYLEVGQSLSINYWSTLEVEDIHLKGTNIQFNRGSNSLLVENLHISSSCGTYTRITSNSAYNNNGIIRKRTAGTLNIDRCMLINIACDTTGGRSYNASNSFKFGNTSPLWNVTAPAGQDLYFRDNSGDQQWSDPNNWEVWNGTTFVPNPANCVPSPADNVFFDVLSFPNANKWVQIDSLAYCQDMRWLPTVTLGATMQLDNNLNIYGTLELDPNMTTVNNTTKTIFFNGAADSIITNQVELYCVVVLNSYSFYDVIGDQDVHTVDFSTYDFYSRAYSTFRSNNLQMNTRRCYFYNRIMDSTHVHLVHNSSGFVLYNADTISYTGNTTFYIEPSGGSFAYAGVYPNFVSNTNVNFYKGLYTFEGDVELNGNSHFIYHPNNSNAVKLDITGTMSLYNGDLTLGKGYAHTFFGHTDSYLNIAGKLTSVGDCTTPVILRGTTGTAGVKISIGNQAASDIRYTLVTNMDNSNNPTINALDAMDGGGNSNWNFNVSSSSSTYYWRAHSANPTDFDGNWQDPGHWTTNPANLVGDSTCLPSLQDSVIFDSLSFSLTSNGCHINTTAFCKTIICKDDIALQGNQPLYVAQSFILDTNMVNYAYTGSIIFVGSGTINPNGTALYSRNISFDKNGGNWDLQNDLTLSNTYNAGSGGLFFYAGTLNTNNYNIQANFWTTGYSKQPMTWNLGSSTIDIYGRSFYNPDRGSWSVNYADSLILNAGTSTININNTFSSTFSPIVRMSSNNNVYPLHYNRVNILNTNTSTQINGKADYTYLFLSGDALFTQNQSFDTLFLSGGYFYRFRTGTTQTFNAPHGKILTDAGPGAFVNIENETAGQTAFFHKAYGSAFCIDYIKVRDNEFTKDPLGAVPPAWQSIHSALKVETGVNSDNIGSSATGIWDFSLPLLVQPKIDGNTTLNFCTSLDTVAIPIPLVGSSPYLISYNWTNDLAQAGTQQDTINDDDNDVNTPFIYYAYFASGATTTNYDINLSTLRCGEQTTINNTNVTANTLAPNLLVTTQRQDSCILYNDNRWHTFMDDIDARPILSLQDNTGSSDLDSLMEVVVTVDFDPTVTYRSGTPYLQRNWTIEPENNTAANVRLYFTQEELDSLTQHTFVASLGRSLLTTSEIQVRKFDSGIIGVGPSTIVPHSVLTWNATNSAPFSSTTDIIGIEFAVSSFSAFIIEPTVPALLSVELLNFDAQLTPKNAVELTWTTEEAKNIDRFVVQRSQDGYTFEAVGAAVFPKNKLVDNNNYLFLDKNPFTATSYYRLQIVSTTGQISYSPIKSISLNGIEFVNIYPNPVRTDQLQLSVTADQASLLQIKVLDELGRILHQREYSSQGGLNHFMLDVQAFSNGVYLLQLSDERGHIKHHRFTIVR